MEKKDVFVFGPDTQFWRICREQALLIWGPTTAILQAAHPGIGQGVAKYSDFQNDSWGRLVRTLETVWTIGFGTVSEAEAMRDKMVKLHRKMAVEYRDEEGKKVCGGGMTPALQYWVLATLIQNSVEGFEAIHGSLSSSEKNQFLEEMHRFGSYFGLQDDFGPGDWKGFREYYQRMVDCGILGSDPVSREIAQQVASPSRPRWLRWMMRPWRFLFSELLPSPLSQQLGFQSTKWRRGQMKLLRRILPWVVRLCPPVLRYPKPYRQARQVMQAGK